jgi:hypothetical protein
MEGNCIVSLIFQFATVLSPIHDKTNIFKIEKTTVLFLALRHVYVEVGGLNLLPNVKAEIMLQLSQTV